MPTPAQPSRRQRRTDETRARLLDAAAAVMRERGYEGASLADITTHADLGVGTLYVHFKDRRTLYEAMVRRELGRLFGRWLEGGKARGAVDRDDELARMIAVTLRFFVEDRARARLLLLDGPPLETWLVEEVGRAIAEVLGSTVRSPELVARLLVGTMLAAGRAALRLPEADSAEPLIETTVDYCLAALTGLTGRSQ